MARGFELLLRWKFTHFPMKATKILIKNIFISKILEHWKLTRNKKTRMCLFKENLAF
jgi:hypothetical protein